MKKHFLVILLSAATYPLFAQQDTVWRRGGLLSLNLSQASLTNWAAGGQNSVAGNAIVNYFANYSRGKNAWDNNIDLGYGLVMQGKKGDVTKSEDKIDISSKYGRKASGHWYYSALLNFRSQFSPGYNYPNDSVIISKFLAPGYALMALGMDYKPVDYFSLFVSPVTGRLVIVNDKDLSDAGAFGVDSGETLKPEVGAYLKVSFNKDLSPVVNLKTTFDVFSNYIENPENMDVNFQLLALLKVSKYISASLSMQVLYDDDTNITVYGDDGVTIAGYGPRTQIKEVIGIGFSYKFASVSVK